MKVKLILPAPTLDTAIAMRDRIAGLILQKDETVMLTNGGVLITTADPARVSLELMAEGFID